MCACVSQEMAVRALKQTGSRNIEAALEYIGKMSYLDPRNELIVRVIKQTSPGMKTTSISGLWLGDFFPTIYFFTVIIEK